MNSYSIKITYHNKKDSETLEIDAEGSIQAVRTVMDHLELDEVDKDADYVNRNIKRIDVNRLT